MTICQRQWPQILFMNPLFAHLVIFKIIPPTTNQLIFQVFHSAHGISCQIPKVFLTIFSWWWKNPDLEPEAGSGTVSLSSGSRSGNPKSIRILRIRIRNTGSKSSIFVRITFSPSKTFSSAWCLQVYKHIPPLFKSLGVRAHLCYILKSQADYGALLWSPASLFHNLL